MDFNFYKRNNEEKKENETTKTKEEKVNPMKEVKRMEPWTVLKHSLNDDTKTS